MTEEKKTKAPAAKKTAAPKKAAAPAKAAAKSAPAKPAAKKPAGKTVTVRQIASPAGRTKDQRGTLIGLKLNKIRRVSTLEDTPAVRGMINKVAHLVEIVEAA